jgi:broad specificity phosphatase PhoE
MSLRCNAWAGTVKGPNLGLEGKRTSMSIDIDTLFNRFGYIRLPRFRLSSPFLSKTSPRKRRQIQSKSAPTMPPIVHCVRHAQGTHNLPGFDPTRRDPPLTETGEAQCAELAAKFPFHSRISQVFSSPLQRTVATAYLGFYPALKNGHCKPEILALPDAQETSDYPLDTGSDLADLQRLWKQKGWSVDLSLVHDGWNDKSWDGRWAPTARRIKARARDARRTIREMVEEMQKAGVQSPEVVLVSHGGFLHYFTEDWEDSDVYSGE